MFDALSEPQRHALGCIAMGQDHGIAEGTLQALLRRMLIEEEHVPLRSDPRIFVTRYYVPIPIHMAWCQWCSDNITAEELAI